jgi:hypothetical protein
MKAWPKVLLIFAIALPLVLGVSLAAHAKILNTSASAANPNNYKVNKQCPENAENEHIGINEQPENVDNEQIGVNEQSENAENEHIGINEQPENVDNEQIGVNEQSENAENEQLEVNEQYPEDNACENHWWNWGNICENRWGVKF